METRKLRPRPNGQEFVVLLQTPGLLYEDEDKGLDPSLRERGGPVVKK